MGVCLRMYFLLPAILSAGLSIAQSQEPAQMAGLPAGAAQVGFRYENPQLQPARYSIVITEDGAGLFHSEPGDTPPAETASYHPLATSLERPVKLSMPIAAQIFSVARSQRYFSGPCEDTRNKVAYQGTKQLSYRGPDGNGSCSYNWSKFTPIQKLTAIFQSVAYTLEEGRRLEVEQKHDRLALDAELGSLLEAVKDNRAIELQTIEPILRGIVEDDTVLDRARSRAKKLLESGSENARLR